MLVLLFGAFQVARVFYVYHSLQKALRGGAGLIARAVNVNYCDIEDTTVTDARNVVVFGNLQGVGPPVVQGLTSDMIEILPERRTAGATEVTDCPCTEELESCNIASGGSAPDFVVVRLTNGLPLSVPFPFVNLGTINLRASVRMPMTGS